LASRKLYDGNGETKDVMAFITDEVTVGSNILPATSSAPKTCYALIRKGEKGSETTGLELAGDGDEECAPRGGTFRRGSDGRV
jgi:hypothetical protein